MKSLLTVLLIILCSSPSFSQSEYDKDVESIDSIIEALYASISGEKGEERDWDRFRNLFIPEAKLIPTGVNNQGVAGYSAWGVEEYIPRVKPFFLENGFIETEVTKEVQRFRNVVHVFSTYQSKNTKEGEIIARGINSIQLYDDGNRWWVVSVFWVSENEENPIPAKYDQGK